jgi:hypothetical protein
MVPGLSRSIGLWGGKRLPVESPDVSAPHRLPAASRQGQTVSGGDLLGLCDRLQTEWLS